MLDSRYIAGLFDGEGYLTMHGRNDGYVMCYVGIVMHDRRILDLLLTQFPESVLYVHDINNKLSKNAGSSWRINSRGAENFVRSIYPHCIVKREDLRWYFKWLELSRSTTTRLTTEQKEQRNILVQNYKVWRAINKA